MAHRKFEVLIKSIGHGDEIEWTEVITGWTKASSRANATKWINKNFSPDEIDLSKNKNDNLFRETWWI
jgi:hypothetical protein